MLLKLLKGDGKVVLYCRRQVLAGEAYQGELPPGVYRDDVISRGKIHIWKDKNKKITLCGMNSNGDDQLMDWFFNIRPGELCKECEGRSDE